MGIKQLTGWHFLPGDKRLRYGTKEIVRIGKTIEVEGPLALCKNGLHASRRAIDALIYAPHTSRLYICRVVLSGKIVEGEDKAVATRRKVIAMADCTETLHEFACLVAEDALRKYGNGDSRSQEAINVKRKWLKGAATNTQLEVASWAAWAAAEDRAAAGAARASAEAAGASAGGAAGAAAGAAGAAAEAAGAEAGVVVNAEQ